jgi:SAM-dependent methyltransferase
LFLSPRPADSELGRIYPANYYAYAFRTSRNLGYRVKAWMDRRAARTYLAHARAPGPVLDVGCGDGRLLEAFASRGVGRALLYGLELSEGSVERARARGFDVRRQRFEDAELPDAFFQLIMLQQVIEHVGDPGAVLARIARLLKPGGAVVLETPNAASWDHRVFRGRYWGGYHFPRHFFLFTAASLCALLRRSGLEPGGVTSLPSPSFWVQSVHHAARESTRAGALSRWFHPHLPSAPVLAMFTAMDLAASPFGITSNMRIVARRI